MAFTVSQQRLRVMVLTLTIAIAALPTCADQKLCNAVTTCRLGNKKWIVKTTVTPSAYHEPRKAAYSKYGVEVRNQIAVEPLSDDMETVTSDSTSTAAHCSFEETAAVDLGALLDAREGALVTLVAGEARLTAHRAVLAARSPAFAAMLCHGSQGASSGQVVVPDVEGPVLRQLLAYLYTLQAPQLPGMAPQLLAAADKFGLSALKSVCEAQVASQLTVENAAATAVLAIRHSSTSLRQAAIAFIRAHLVQVLGTQGWGHAVRYQPEDFIEVNRLLAESPAETSTPTAADSQATIEAQSLPHSSKGRTPVAATPHSQATTEAQNQPHSIQGQTPAAATPHSQPTTEAQSQPHSSQGQTPVAAASPSPPYHSPPPADDAVTRLRGLSAEDRGRRLIEAGKAGAVGEVRALLAAGADVEAMDELRANALHYAAQEGHLEVARLLLAGGAQVDARTTYENTPLHAAAYYGHVGVARLLMASSADPNARQDGGWTPLHWAAYNGHAEVAAALLEAGADRGAKTDGRQTPLDVARSWNRQKLIKILT